MCVCVLLRLYLCISKPKTYHQWVISLRKLRKPERIFKSQRCFANFLPFSGGMKYSYYARFFADYRNCVLRGGFRGQFTSFNSSIIRMADIIKPKESYQSLTINRQIVIINDLVNFRNLPFATKLSETGYGNIT